MLCRCWEKLSISLQRITAAAEVPQESPTLWNLQRHTHCQTRAHTSGNVHTQLQTQRQILLHFLTSHWIKPSWVSLSRASSQRSLLFSTLRFLWRRTAHCSCWVSWPHMLQCVSESYLRKFKNSRSLVKKGIQGKQMFILVVYSNFSILHTYKPS